MFFRAATFYRNVTTNAKTVDPNEIKKFNDMAKEWWSKSGGCGPLHSLNNCRIPWIVNRLREIGVISPDAKSSASLSGLSVLDVGCGGGILSESLSQLGCKTTGLDASQELINLAKLHAQSQDLPNLEYTCSTIQDFANQNTEKYDVVVSSETIEHVTEKEEFVKDCVRCLKPEGSIFMTTPNKTCLSAFCLIFMMENVFKKIPKGTHTYEMFIHINDLKAIFEKENCKTVFTKGLAYDPFKDEWSLINNENLSYVIHGVKYK